MTRLKSLFVMIVVGLILGACSLIDLSSTSMQNDSPDAENGEQIYFTSTSQRGGRISFTGGPAFGGMMMDLI